MKIFNAFEVLVGKYKVITKETRNGHHMLPKYVDLDALRWNVININYIVLQSQIILYFAVFRKLIKFHAK